MMERSPRNLNDRLFLICEFVFDLQNGSTKVASQLFQNLFLQNILIKKMQIRIYFKSRGRHRIRLGLDFKTLRLHELKKMDRFRNKLVP
jgi:hypothetical protein